MATPEQWPKIKDIVGAALDRYPAERSAFLDQACSHDKELRAEVESLLGFDSESASSLTDCVADTAEDMLRSIGGGKVVLANSIAEAQAAIVGEKFSFALLDVNLGSDNSLPIARALIAKGVPFAFGTGYGEALALPDTMTSTFVARSFSSSRMCELITTTRPFSASRRRTSIICKRWRGSMPLNGSSSSRICGS